MRKNNALTRVRKYFPHVEEVFDAKKAVVISVSEMDSRKATKKDPGNCALARACIRQHIVDGAIIGIGNSYLIKGKKAFRYKTSASVGREITSFDRHHDFAAGTNYLLSKISKCQRLGQKPWTQKTGPRIGKKPGPRAVHRTANIRALGKNV